MSGLRVGARDAVFWFSGLATAIVVNRVSGTPEYLKVLVITISVAAAIAATAWLLRQRPTSYLRRYTPSVLLTIALPLVAVAAAGPWMDHLMVVAAALVAVAVITTPKGPAAALAMLGGTVFLGVGFMAVGSGLRGLASSTELNVAMVVQGVVIAIPAGALLFVKGEEILKFVMRPDPTHRMLVLGLLASVGAAVAAVSLFRAPGGVAVALLLGGMAVALIGSNVKAVLTAERVTGLREHWGELRRDRDPGEPYPSYGSLVRRFLKAVGRALDRMSTRPSQPDEG